MARPPHPSGSPWPGATRQRDPAPCLPPANNNGKRKQIKKGKLKKEKRNPSAFAHPDPPPARPPADAIGGTWAGLVLHSGHGDPWHWGWQGTGTTVAATGQVGRAPPLEPQETPPGAPAGGRGGRFGPGCVALFLLLCLFFCFCKRESCRSGRQVREHNPEVSSSLCKPRGTGCPGGDGCTKGMGGGRRGRGWGSWIVVPLCPRKP